MGILDYIAMRRAGDNPARQFVADGAAGLFGANNLFSGAIDPSYMGRLNEERQQYEGLPEYAQQNDFQRKYGLNFDEHGQPIKYKSPFNFALGGNDGPSR